MKNVRPRFREIGQLSYGDNPRDTGAIICSRASKGSKLALPKWRIRGDEKFPKPSWTNVKDWDAGRRTMVQVAATLEKNGEPVPFMAGIVKHGATLGFAMRSTPAAAIRGAFDAHPFAAMGGALFVNFPFTLEEADITRSYRWHTGKLRPMALVAAPEVSDEAYDHMRRKTKPCLMFENPHFAHLGIASMARENRYGPVHGGMLVEGPDSFVVDLNDPEMRRHHAMKEVEVEQRMQAARMDWILAAAVSETSPGNVVTIAADGHVMANGISHQDRVGAITAAVAQLEAASPGMGTWQFPRHAIASGNSYFPSPDGVALLQRHGIDIVYATSGSERDAEVREFCKNHDMILLQMPDSRARGFTH